MPKSDQSSANTGAAKFKDPLNIIIGLVGIAYTITFVTVDKIEKLLGSELGSSILLTVFYIWICRLCWNKIYSKKHTHSNDDGQWINKAYRIIFLISTVVYVAGVILVWTKAEILYTLFPKKDIGIIVNNIDHDNGDLLITRGIKDNIAHTWTSLPESDSLSLNDDLHDQEKMNKVFKSKRYTHGLFAFGSFRPVDSVLSGEIYLFNVSLDNVDKNLINFPDLNSIHVTVTKKVALFGNFIASLAFQAQKNWSRSNAVLSQILKDSLLLHDDFIYYCYAFRTNNYSNLKQVAFAKLEANRANILRPALQDSYFERIDHKYIAHSPGNIVDTINIIDDIGDSHRYADSIFFYKGLAVVGMESDTEGLMHCYIKQCGGDYHKVITWPKSTVTHLLDSIISKM